MTHGQLLKSTHTFQKQESSGIGVVCRRSEHDAHRTTTLDCSRSSGVEVVPNSRVCVYVGTQRLNNAAHHSAKNDNT